MGRQRQIESRSETGDDMQIRFSRHHKWNKAVAEGQALVAFPPSPIDMMQMFGATNSSMTDAIKKLMASDHPV